MGKARTQTRTQFTDVVLRNLPIPAFGQVQYADGKLTGFGVRVSSSGAKIFYLSYRVYGRSRRLMFGRYPYVSLADARAKAHEALSALEKNTDPQAQKTSNAGFTTTVGTFVETHSKRHNRPSTATETERLLRTVFVPRWHERPLETIKWGDVVAVLDALVAADTQAPPTTPLLLSASSSTGASPVAALKSAPAMGLASRRRHRAATGC